MSQNSHTPDHTKDAIALPEGEESDATCTDLEKNTHSNKKLEEAETTYLPTILALTVSFGLSLCFFMANLDETIVATAAPHITEEFNSLTQISWLGAAYQISFTVVQPLYASLSEIFGLRPTILMTMTIFLIGSGLCSAAQSMIWLIMMRALQGVGGGGVVGMVYVTLAKVVPPKQLSTYQSVVTSIFMLSSIIGPILGGVFSEVVNWRWGFLINIPIGIVSMALVACFLRVPPTTGSLRSKFKRIDFAGSAALLAVTVFLLVAISVGGGMLPWNSPTVIVLLCLTPVALAVFVWIEGKIAVNPVLPLHLFRSRELAIYSLANFILGIALFGFIFYLPILFQIVNNISATSSGIQLLPFLVITMGIDLACTFLLHHVGHLRTTLWVGHVLLIIGGGLLSTLGKESSSGMRIGYMVVTAVGMGLNFVNLILAMQFSAEPKDIGLAAGISVFFRTIGFPFGVAIGGSIVNNFAQAFVDSHPDLPSDILKHDPYALLKHHPDIREDAVQAYTQGIRGIQWTFRVLTILLGINFACLLFVRRV
ncbi:uncharacterized protein VTP21DRAFT_5761 [Calcarisporiella thermophila]|uniref:uncharacterized protein n=1 Tax=Calcarisporiella thermophila TaxID=911321 RepID=UPI003743CCA4